MTILKTPRVPARVEVCRRRPHAACVAGSILAAAVAGQAEPFAITTRPVQIPEVGTVSYSVLHCGGRQFSLLPPLRWRGTADEKAPVVTWTSPEYHTSLTVRLEENSEGVTPTSHAEHARRAVLKELPEAKIKASYPCFAGGARGFTVDFDHLVSERFPMSVRAAFVPVTGGVVRFTLSAPAAEFSKRQTEFNQLINSFSVETNTAPTSTSTASASSAAAR